MYKSTDVQEIRVCQKCGYERGFHVFFKEIENGKAKIGLICPSCGQSYDIGWVTSEIGNFEPEEGETYEEMKK